MFPSLFTCSVLGRAYKLVGNKCSSNYGYCNIVFVDDIR